MVPLRGYAEGWIVPFFGVRCVADDPTYTKLHSSIATSLIMALPVARRWVWSFMLSAEERKASVDRLHEAGI